MGNLGGPSCARPLESPWSGADPAPKADLQPVLSIREREALLALSPRPLPPPRPDPDNPVADNPLAVAFGRALFFDPGFSGKLLEADNVGGAGSLG